MFLRECMDAVRGKRPLVHHITNYVTVNDCANMTLAAGASPVMADDPEEAAEMTGIASALALNIGTLNTRTIPSMFISGKEACRRGIPIVLDPVGCGATKLRTHTARKLLTEARPSIVRGNLSEIAALYDGSAYTRGVDSGEKRSEQDQQILAVRAAAAWRCVVVITGITDMVSDGVRTAAIMNGCGTMAQLTGTGCMCTSLLAAFAGAAPERIWEAAVTAVVCMGLSGEMAEEHSEGLGTFHAALLDAAGHMTGDMLEKRGKWHEI